MFWWPLEANLICESSVGTPSVAGYQVTVVLRSTTAARPGLVSGTELRPSL